MGHRDLSDIFGHLVGMTGKALRRGGSALLSDAGHDLTMLHAIVLMHLENEAGMSQQQIGDLLDLDKTATCRLIDHLEEQSLVRRVAGVEDRRRNRVNLTQAGQKKCQEIFPLMRRLHEEALRGIPEDKVDACKEVLGSVLKNLVE